MGFFDFLFGPPSRDQFARRFMAALRQAGDGRTMQYNRGEFRVVFLEDGKDVGHSNLENCYAEYVRAPRRERPRCLSAFVRASLSHLKEMPTEFADAVHDLRPKIWMRAALESIRWQTRLKGESPPELPYEPIGEHLALTLVYDLPEAVRSISQSDLHEWGITFYEAMEAAKVNLGQEQAMIASIGETLFASATGDTYDASRLVLCDFVDKFAVRGDKVAMIPNRDNLLITGADDDEGLTMLLTLAESILEEQPRPMASTALRFDGDVWVDWLPPADHPLFARFQQLKVKFLYQTYAEQKAALEAIYERTGEELFVATFSGLERDGIVTSYAVWTNGIATLLPRTDSVAFLRDPEGTAEPLFVAWDRMTAIVGHLLQATDDYPTRYLVTDFPTDAQWAALAEQG